MANIAAGIMRLAEAQYGENDHNHSGDCWSARQADEMYKNKINYG